MMSEVHDLDLGVASDSLSCFLRARVTMAVDKPLQRYLCVDFLDNGKVIAMLLHYERLMDYCFRCDRLGHVMDECVVEVEKEREVSFNAARKLVVWLQASSP
ncbi:hypothetical protein LWI28_007438 [Acer negundo]|uniref:CCHC-type domain-containing protein n=1 Tax=Acer negundo TaxID=4023 RepID=A0AAD5IU63_ACENE|nr:hypothetical protein LWI28_007438 [Acer negundo]